MSCDMSCDNRVCVIAEFPPVPSGCRGYSQVIAESACSQSEAAGQTPRALVQSRTAG